MRQAERCIQPCLACSGGSESLHVGVSSLTLQGSISRTEDERRPWWGGQRQDARGVLRLSIPRVHAHTHTHTHTHSLFLSLSLSLSHTHTHTHIHFSPQDGDGRAPSSRLLLRKFTKLPTANTLSAGLLGTTYSTPHLTSPFCAPTAQLPHRGRAHPHDSNCRSPNETISSVWETQ
jgi:hypothetical protein